MDNPKNDLYYVRKMLTDLDYIIEHMKNITVDALKADEVLLDSMMFRLIQLQESARKLTDDFKTAHFYIPWTDISGLRNKIVHDYGNVDLDVVFDTLTQDIPTLRELISDAI